MERTRHSLDGNSHHARDTKRKKSTREMCQLCCSAEALSAQKSLFCLTATRRPWNAGPQKQPPPPPLLFPVSSNLAKINGAYNRSTCPVLVFSGNAWGEHRSVSINLSSETPINGWSRSERDIAAVFTHTQRVCGSPRPSHILCLLRSVEVLCRSVKCKL